MSRRSIRWLAWSAWACSTLLLLVALGLTAAGGRAFGWVVLFGLVQLAFSGVGTVLVLRLAWNPIGWLFLGFGVLAAIAIAAEAYSVRALQPDSLPGGLAALVVSSVIYGPGLFAVVLALFMLFPEGRLPSRRWRPVAWLTVLAGGIFAVLQQVGPGSLNSLDPAQSVKSPIVLGGAAWSAAAVVIGLCALTCLAVFVASVVSLIGRFRHAVGTLRQQMKWFVGAALLFMVSMACQLVLWNVSARWASVAGLCVFGIGAVALPIATGIAILRYRLYEIDVIIRRTLVYATLVAVLAVVYLAGVAAIGSGLQTITGQSGALAVTLSTLAVAAAFQPLRRRIQHTVDHRFYRRGYDATRTLEVFSGRLRDEIDLTALHAEILSVAHATLQPRHASLWLRATPSPTTPTRVRAAATARSAS